MVGTCSGFMSILLPTVEHVPTIRYAEDFGAGKWRESDIEIVGDALARLTQPSFNIKRKPVRAYGRSGFLSFINNALVPKPVINTDRCTACGVCVKSCPVEPKALSWDGGDTSKSPVYDYDRCIRCYCCQELCPESAIELKTPTLRRFLNLFG
jgi:Pyruvate/2-oxoacid:ferredoxin oxidoreductase delta subunit